MYGDILLSILDVATPYRNKTNKFKTMNQTQSNLSRLHQPTQTNSTHNSTHNLTHNSTQPPTNWSQSNSHTHSTLTSGGPLGGFHAASCFPGVDDFHPREPAAAQPATSWSPDL